MNIEDFVNWSIYNYPTLFRVKNNPKMSRLRVLSHLFFTIGNGFIWDLDQGILYCENIDNIPTLDNDFFDKELYIFQVTGDKLEHFLQFLNNQSRFHYITKENQHRNTYVIFESNKENAASWQWDWDYGLLSQNFQKTSIQKMLAMEEFKDIHYTFKAESDSDIFPEEINEYSAIYELIQGKTSNAIKLGTYKFSEYPIRKDWLMACLDLAKETKNFYNDPVRRSNHYYYTNKIPGLTQDVYDKYRTKQLKYLEKFIKKFDV